jgi:hypothetical protein
MYTIPFEQLGLEDIAEVGAKGPGDVMGPLTARTRPERPAGLVTQR